MAYADDLIGAHTVRELTTAFTTAAPGLSLATLAASSRQAGTGTLRARSEALRRALLTDLPHRYADLAALVRTTKHSPALFRGWMLLPVTTTIATRARQDGTCAAYDDAMALLGELTSLFTSEFALRSMLVHDLSRGLRVAHDWARSPDENLRRLAVAGTRPHLPWAPRVPAILSAPGGTVPILDLLYRDQTAYVRRPVTDHLADLARQDPQLALRTAARWLTKPDHEVPRLVTRGLRRLVRQGHPDACRLAGVASAPR